MKINWKQRFRNRTWLLTFVAAVAALIYQSLKVLGIVPHIAQEQLMELVTMLVGILTLLGIVVDPTTPGTKDSNLAMSYGKHDPEEIDNMGRGWDDINKEVNDEQQQSGK
ncbi:phage holin [Mogibacterium timidum]|mgnify:FL=1|uniref:phage holin n=1 Tax=Mogibacterium timidum TaxID=35519 RepID=UPI0028DC0DC3|nr:phage holin [Mogibacterium timidum]